MLRHNRKESQKSPGVIGWNAIGRGELEGVFIGVQPSWKTALFCVAPNNSQSNNMVAMSRSVCASVSAL